MSTGNNSSSFARGPAGVLSGAGFTQSIRDSAEAIANASAHVKIDRGAVAGYTAALLGRYPLVTKLNESHFLSEASPKQTAAYILALDTVNFGSGWFPLAREAGIELEYAAVAKGLKSAFMTGRLNTPRKWANARAADCHDIFGVPPNAHPELDGLMDLFAAHLRASGERVLADYGGEVLNLIDAAQGSAVALAATVSQWPNFSDAPFYKRAQIFAADIHLGLRGRVGADFCDMYELTCFADNMVPHVLRCDGILNYTPLLAAKIDAGVALEAGSAEEIDIRAAAIHAVELMKRAAGGKATSVNLDHILWNRRYEAEAYSKPPHRTMTVWY